jgi:hypothetical protein
MFAIAVLIGVVVTAPRAAAQEADDSGATDPGSEAAAVADDDPSAVTIYRDELDPYGHWVEHARWGVVWIPSVVVVGRHFTPYRSRGHWAVDDYSQWTWVSDYAWGYIVFHYGRWVWIGELQVWAWIPGRRYAPAWVVWRVGEPGWDYVGWAPMPPSWCWFGGIAVTCVYDPVWAFWFVPSVYLFHVHWHAYVLHSKRAHVVARHTHIHHRHKHATGTAHGETEPPSAAAKTARRPASPTLAEARIPKTAIPKSRARVPRDARALQLEKRPASRAAPPHMTPARKATPERRTKPPAKAAPPPRTKPPPKAAPPRRTKPKAAPSRKPKPPKKARPAPTRTPRTPTPPRRRAPPRRTRPPSPHR